MSSNDHGSTPQQPSEPTAPLNHQPRPTKNNTATYVVVGIIALALIGVLVYWLTRTPAQPNAPQTSASATTGSSATPPQESPAASKAPAAGAITMPSKVGDCPLMGETNARGAAYRCKNGLATVAVMEKTGAEMRQALTGIVEGNGYFCGILNVVNAPVCYIEAPTGLIQVVIASQETTIEETKAFTELLIPTLR